MNTMPVELRTMALKQLTDEDVIARVRAGETALFEVIMRRHNQRIFRAARSIVKDSAEAEDVMQEAYVKAYQHLGDFEGRARFSTWLTRIAVHEALARVRGRKRYEPMDEEHDGDEGPEGEPVHADPERTAATRELVNVVEDAIDALPEIFRTVFVLRTVEEMSVAETAACLGIPEETVKTRLHRARAQLQRKIETRIENACSDAFSFHLIRCDRVVEGVFARLFPAS